MRVAEPTLVAAFTRAGMADARLRFLANAALEKHHGNIERSLKTFVELIDDDSALIREALRFYLKAQSLLRAGQLLALKNLTKIEGAQQSSSRGGSDHALHENQKTFVRPSREPSAGQKAAAAAVAKTLALTVLDTRKTSDGRPWGNVGAHELDGMDRDGALARAIKAKLGTLTNEQRFMTLRELITPKRFDEIWRETRESVDA